MTSQTDLDQGGTFREWVRTYMGPSVGWVYTPARSVLVVTAAGTYVVNLSTTLVIINTIMAVILTLPSALNASIPANSLPGTYIKSIINVVDISGAPNTTINPISIAETIMGLASIQLLTAYGSYALRPDNTFKGWTAGQ